MLVNFISLNNYLNNPHEYHLAIQNNEITAIDGNKNLNARVYRAHIKALKVLRDADSSWLNKWVFKPFGSLKKAFCACLQHSNDEINSIGSNEPSDIWNQIYNLEDPLVFENYSKKNHVKWYDDVFEITE